MTPHGLVVRTLLACQLMLACLGSAGLHTVVGASHGCCGRGPTAVRACRKDADQRRSLCRHRHHRCRHHSAPAHRNESQGSGQSEQSHDCDICQTWCRLAAPPTAAREIEFIRFDLGAPAPLAVIRPDHVPLDVVHIRGPPAVA